MQPLALLHIALTCSFVLLLAYLLSTILSYFASFLLHGMRPSATSLSRKASSSRRGLGRSTSPSTDRSEIAQELQQAEALMQLQEEDEDQEDEEEEDAYEDAETRMASMPTPIVPAGSGFELADSIFQDGTAEDEDASRPEYSKPFIDAYEHKGGMGDPDPFEKVKNHEGSFDGEHPDRTMKTDEHGSAMREKEELGQGAHYRHGNIANSPNGKLGDPQGSTSLQQRLPPTWSDLERMVNLSSKKLPSPAASAPSQPPLSDDVFE